LKGSDVTKLVGTISTTSFARLTTFGRRHHSPLESIFCASLWRLHPNVISPKIGTFVVPRVWRLISFSNQFYFANERVKPYSPKKTFSNSV